MTPDAMNRSVVKVMGDGMHYLIADGMNHEIASELTAHLSMFGTDNGNVSHWLILANGYEIARIRQ